MAANPPNEIGEVCRIVWEEGAGPAPDYRGMDVRSKLVPEAAATRRAPKLPAGRLRGQAEGQKRNLSVNKFQPTRQ
jgi:hypothetical protein